MVFLFLKEGPLNSTAFGSISAHLTIFILPMISGFMNEGAESNWAKLNSGPIKYLMGPLMGGRELKEVPIFHCCPRD